MNRDHPAFGKPTALLGGLILAAIQSACGAGGPPPQESPGTTDGSIVTAQFEARFSVVPPEGWVVVDDRFAVALTPPIAGNVPAERVVVFVTGDAVVIGGRDEGFMSWPDDFVAWLADHPRTTDPTGVGSMDVTVLEVAQLTIAGESATLIDATTSFTAEPELAETMNFIRSAQGEFAGTDVLLFDGTGRLRLAILHERGVAIAYHATDDAFSQDRFAELIESIRFLDE